MYLSLDRRDGVEYTGYRRIKCIMQVMYSVNRSEISIL